MSLPIPEEAIRVDVDVFVYDANIDDGVNDKNVWIHDAYTGERVLLRIRQAYQLHNALDHFGPIAAMRVNEAVKP